jgi:hypothetical protein
MVHEGEANKLEGLEESTQLVSVGNPEAVPETSVPIGPDVGVSSKMLVGPAVTVNVAVAESAAFVWTPTVYALPGEAPRATVKLPVREPPAIAHDWELKSDEGEAVNMQTVPW